ncbi:hypothetical protein KFK09_013684 [Dendrobium nobile]|uniref:Uncharacterized protein n=1 Tax=Dendrobium nobile TaxID=94219 RepID=A0A8T3B9S3_DENNO|nr:hypothetical protein KFK09_013684 [Dendrobium nobile]
MSRGSSTIKTIFDEVSSIGHLKDDYHLLASVSETVPNNATTPLNSDGNVIASKDNLINLAIHALTPVLHANHLVVNVDDVNVVTENSLSHLEPFEVHPTVGINAVLEANTCLFNFRASLISSYDLIIVVASVDMNVDLHIKNAPISLVSLSRPLFETSWLLSLPLQRLLVLLLQLVKSLGLVWFSI